MSRGRVYIVEDEPVLAMAVCELVESVDLEAMPFATTEVFLDAYVEDRPTVVVTDLRLPGVGGMVLQDALKARGATAPIIFLTGHGDTRTAVKAMKRGAFDFLEKPVRDQELLERVQAGIAAHAKKLAARRRRRGLDEELQDLLSPQLELLMLVETDGPAGESGDPAPAVRIIDLREPADDPAPAAPARRLAPADDDEPRGADLVQRLSPRQRQILMALRDGESNKAIARRLGILENTVKAQMKAIFRRLGVTNRTQAAMLANSCFGDAPPAAAPDPESRHPTPPY